MEKECKLNLEIQRDDSLIFQFHHIHKAMFRLANKMLEESSIPIKMKQIPILMTVFWLENPSQQKIADIIKRDKSSVLRTVNLLEEKRLMKVDKDTTDGRRKILALTEKGVSVALEISELIKEIEDKILKTLTDRPKNEFLYFLKQATKRLEEAANS